MPWEVFVGVYLEELEPNLIQSSPINSIDLLSLLFSSSGSRNTEMKSDWLCYVGSAIGTPTTRRCDLSH